MKSVQTSTHILSAETEREENLSISPELQLSQMMNLKDTGKYWLSENERDWKRNKSESVKWESGQELAHYSHSVSWLLATKKVSCLNPDEQKFFGNGKFGNIERVFKWYQTIKCLSNYSSSPHHHHKQSLAKLQHLWIQETKTSIDQSNYDISTEENQIKPQLCNTTA